MRLQRPTHLLVQRHDPPAFSFPDLLAGGPGVVLEAQWLALAPHLDAAIVLDHQDLGVLDAVPAGGCDDGPLASRFGAERVARLVEQGLLIGDHHEHAGWRAREQALRDDHWWTPAAVAHAFGRWQGVDIAEHERREGKRSLAQMIAEFGSPPPETIALRPPGDWQPLPAPILDSFDTLLGARTTCRNFDPGAALALDDLSSLLWRGFGAQASASPAPGATMLKKHSPSGGGLHPIDAYLLVQRVSGLAPGLYHYQPVAHALEPLDPVDPSGLAAAAHDLVAGQAWFADAPVLVLMAARFGRNFWKYRGHAKAWRVIHLDAGHLSQTLYLAATDLGLGAFVTAAINDRCAEQLFALDGLRTGAIAVMGFGRRGGPARASEFDPLGKAVG